MSYVESSREPLRDLVDTPSALDACLDALSEATGPVAFDTERAHGHRYWPKAYLLQIRREGAGTWLIDPIAFEDGSAAQLGALVAATGDATWLVHAASQDLPSMREVGIIPPAIFDTELAARLLAKPGASLGALLEAELGVKLRKAHSADNWSKRPLPPSWLTYAALDVDYLIELAQVLETELVQARRFDWARQEFAETLERFSRAPEPRIDPWRRLSGVTTLRTPRQYAVARELWRERDAIAAKRDRPPGWILHDSAILAVATAARDQVPGRAELQQLSAFGASQGQRYLTNWLAALDRVARMPESQYPPRRAPRDGLPHPKSWDRINPEAAARWAKVRPAIDILACDLGGLQPSLVAPPAVLQQAVFAHESVTEEILTSLGARPWQAGFLAPAINEALGAE
ncbi:HRDC domain-containing protein [Tessaracoccus flavus]|nr:HRDC domain-containing protein [Tessaracoccus flavus]SDY67003.1 ribonuclease D [Tessaracoccus flavus]